MAFLDMLCCAANGCAPCDVGQEKGKTDQNLTWDDVALGSLWQVLSVLPPVPYVALLPLVTLDRCQQTAQTRLVYICKWFRRYAT